MSFGGGERLAGLLSDPAARGILGASAGLLAAGAPRTDRPVSLGEAISTGLLSGTQAFDAATQRKADQAAANELSALRKARMAALSKPERITAGTKLGRIKQDLADGTLTPKEAQLSIAELFKEEEKLPLSPEGRVAYDRLNSPELFSSEQPVAETPEFKPADIDFRVAFGGDIAGVLTDVANIGAGAFGRAASVDRLRESAKLNNLNETLRGLLVKRSSKTGSVYSLKEVAKILPNASTSNVNGVEMYRALLPELEKMLVEAQATLNSDDKTTQTYKTQARRAVSELPSVIATIKNSLSEFDASREPDPRGNRRRGSGSVDSSQGKIKFKLIKQGNDGNN